MAILGMALPRVARKLSLQAGMPQMPVDTGFAAGILGHS